MSDPIERLHAHIEASFSALMPWRARFPQEIDDLKDVLETLTAKKNKLSGEHQRLSIGIMGQVKAGKSTFLNALLFDGNPVLPEAATPKTANLTRISWGAKPTLTVTFYSREEWQQIEHAAAREDNDIEARVGRALVEMARHHKVDVNAILEAGTKVVEADDIVGLIGIMNDYVGESGKYTALVQMTELLLPDEALIGYEIVDTPGMNDPVPSRTDKTREYMSTCDVVLFLSRCGQFLDQSDLQLLGVQLPTKGVKRMALVAGQMDSAILDDGYDRRSLQDTEANIRKRLTQRAHELIGRLVTMREEQGSHELATLFRDLQRPLFASTFAHLFASWPEARWRERGSMQVAYDNMNELADDQWSGRRLTRNDWARIGNFEEIRAVYDRARAGKDALLQAQRESVLGDFTRQWRERLRALDQAVALRDGVLCVNELKEIGHQQAACEMRIAGIAAKLGEIVDKAIGRAKDERENMCQLLAKDIARYSSLKKQTGAEEERRSRKISTSVWYKPWTWGDEETVYYTITRNYEYVAAADAIERLADYGRASAQSLESRFREIVSTEALRVALHQGLMTELDTSRVEFDAGVFRATLEKTLTRLRLPELSLDIGNVRRKIGARFSGEVRGEQIELLNQAVKDSLLEISQRLETEVTNKVKELCAALTRLNSRLAERMTEDLREELTQLQSAFAEKEHERGVHARIQASIAQCLASLDDEYATATRRPVQAGTESTAALRS